eukprot:symbB.v1.2.029285.t1/scaffold3188.1/size61668/3
MPRRREPSPSDYYDDYDYYSYYSESRSPTPRRDRRKSRRDRDRGRNGTIAAVRGGVATVAARGDPLEAVVVVVVLLEAKVMVVVAHHVVRLKVQKEIQSVPQAVRENLPTPMCGTNW